MNRRELSLLIIAGVLCATSLNAIAKTITVPLHLVTANETGPTVGTVTATDTQYGLLLIPNLHQLSPGLHGFHVHETPSCKDNGMAAGGHLDPENTGKHLGPYNSKGHLGDLPALYVAPDGTATLPVLAPRLTVQDIQDHALIIHDSGDTYSDTPDPLPLGGGGNRMACGVVK